MAYRGPTNLTGTYCKVTVLIVGATFELIGYRQKNKAYEDISLFI
jgi:hypothetical protein